MWLISEIRGCSDSFGFSGFYQFSQERKLVDQSECGTNQAYLVDFIQLTFNPKLLDPYEIRRLFLDEGLSAPQISRKYNVSKATILSTLHRMGVRVQTQAGRITNPNNYRVRNPPYGFRIQEGRLVLNKSEIRICRLVVELIARQGFSKIAVARELGLKGYKNRIGDTKWDHSTVRNIFERWKNKL